MRSKEQQKTTIKKEQLMTITKKSTLKEQPKKLVTFWIFDKRHEETWPDQPKNKYKYKDHFENGTIEQPWRSYKTFDISDKL